MRRRVTYALGGHFIASHKSMLFLSYSRVSGESFWSTLGFRRARANVSAALFDPQAAQIRVGVLFFWGVEIDTLVFILRPRTYAASLDS